MSDLKKHGGELVHKLDALTLRERGMVFVALLAVMFFAWDLLLNSPLQAKYGVLTQTLGQAETQRQGVQFAIDGVRARAGVDPNAEVRARLQGLNEEKQTLETRRQAFRDTLITPQRMLELLRGVLAGHGDLKFVALQTHPARPLFAVPATARSGEKNEADTPAIYRHDLTVEFEGEYFAVLDYLWALENQPLFWESIVYEVRTYPQAAVQLRVFTLSLDKEWLGV